ncbi:uncharacterized protein ATC70_010840 [Mucor velutinosus]|uniref:Uncharacterized protein n=1 Tax=Mucor velutinosus TaxID=708070 RepID=A0AAN7DEB8_9FUNG|nr:hypothetical protein ATC70_010840 [Mucor velutinosus]
MAIANNDMHKREEVSTEATNSNEEINSKKSLTYTLPTLYAPMSTSTVTEDATSTEDPGQYHITLFTPAHTSSSILDMTEATQKTVDPYAPLPTKYSVLVSKAPNEVTRTTKSWAIATSTASASASTTPSIMPVKSYSGLNKGELAGVIVGSIAGGLMAIYLLYVICWGRRKALRKAREEKSLKDMEKKTDHVSTIHLDYDSDEDEKNPYMHHDDNQPVSLPRTQPQYDPTRIYCSTSRSDPKEDFRSYYRTSPSNTGNSSSLSEGSTTPLNVHNTLQPFYGGFKPFYGPMLQHQPPAFVNHSTNSMSLYAPHQKPYTASTMPVAGNASQHFSPMYEIGAPSSTMGALYYHRLNPATPEIYQHQQVYRSNIGSPTNKSGSERCGSTVSSVLMHGVVEDEDIQSLPPSEPATALHSVDQNVAQQKQSLPSQPTSEDLANNAEKALSPI